MKFLQETPQWLFDLFGEKTQKWLLQTMGENSLYEIFVSLGIFLLTILVARIFYKIFGGALRRVTGRTKTKLDDILVDKLEEPLVFAIIIIGGWWALERLHFAEGPQGFINNVFQVLIAIDVTWLIVRMVDSAIQEYVVPVVEKSDTNLDDQMLPILRKGVRWILWIVGIIVGLNNAGYNVGAMLAGVGIGGIAMALAAKDFVANIFGGITIFLDKPFSIHERIKINGYDGFVREIGIRSTRLQTLEGRMVTIPNYKFTESEVENVTSEPNRKVKMMLGLTYDTTHEQLQQGIDILNGIVDQHKLLEDDRYALFNSFGDFSLNLLFIYYVKSGEDVMEVPSQVNFEVLKQFNEAGLEFAFPTQTIIAQTES